MPFAATTRDAIMDILCLPVVAPVWVQHVQEAMDRVENYGGDTAVARIEAYITAYGTAETNWTSSSDEAFMIRADVVEWQPGGRLTGYKNEMAYYQGKILSALFLPSEQAEIKRMMGQSNRVGNGR